MKFTKSLLVLLILAGLYFFWSEDDQPETLSPVSTPRSAQEPSSAPPKTQTTLKTKRVVSAPAPETRPRPQALQTDPPQAPPSNLKSPSMPPEERPTPPRPTAHFVVQDGLAVTEGDIVLGYPDDPQVQKGIAVRPPLKLWPSAQIVYHIQPDLEAPERVSRALSLFADTPIEFVPYREGDEDVLVFEPGSGPCKSYVGHIGGHQPVWISPGCSSGDIAHEILHALGFIHEQNRSDRDQYLEVNISNVQEDHTFNFEKLPPDYMRVTGLSEFDFRSMMIYPETMFARTGTISMRPIDPSDRIEPSRSALSPQDVQRVREAYRNR